LAKEGHPKISEDLGKIKKEISRSLRRLYTGRNSVPGSQDNLYGSKRPKPRKKVLKEHTPCPRRMVHSLGTFHAFISKEWLC